MKRYPDYGPSRWDALVYGAVLLLAVCAALVIWGGQDRSGSLTAVVSVDGVEQKRVALADLRKEEDWVLAAGGYELHLHLSADGAEITSSTCPTQDCVHTGKITRAGQSIVCLPARVSVQLVGQQAGDGVDAVIG